MQQSAPRLIILCAIVSLLVACGTAARQGAASGAKSGVIGGAVAGAVGSIFWGGNVLENMVAAGVTSAAAGAAVGAVAGSSVDNENAKQKDARAGQAARDTALADLLGPDNYAAARELALCRHDRAIKLSREAVVSATTSEQRAYALLLEAVAEEESGDEGAAAAIYPQLIEADPARGSLDKARSQALAAILKVQQARKDHGLPPACP